MYDASTCEYSIHPPGEARSNPLSLSILFTHIRSTPPDGAITELAVSSPSKRLPSLESCTGQHVPASSQLTLSAFSIPGRYALVRQRSANATTQHHLFTRLVYPYTMLSRQTVIDYAILTLGIADRSRPISEALEIK
jgi:hypothetical protein